MRRSAQCQGKAVLTYVAPDKSSHTSNTEGLRTISTVRLENLDVLKSFLLMTASFLVLTRAVDHLYQESCRVAERYPLLLYDYKDLRSQLLGHHTPQIQINLQPSSIFQKSTSLSSDLRDKNRGYPNRRLKMKYGELHTRGGRRSILLLSVFSRVDEFPRLCLPSKIDGEIQHVEAILNTSR
jgi:hypothetical protein